MNTNIVKQNIVSILLNMVWTKVLLFLTLVFFVSTLVVSPLGGVILGLVLIIFSLITTSLRSAKKHKKSYLKGEISKVTFRLNICLDVIYIVLFMTVAGISGLYLAEFATKQIDNGSIRLAVGIFIGLLVGVSVGLLSRKIMDSIRIVYLRIWSRKNSPVI